MSVEAVSEDLHARRRQVITHAFWAIREILVEQHAAALAELSHAQRSGGNLIPPAAKIAALEDITFAFTQLAHKEPAPHV